MTGIEGMIVERSHALRVEALAADHSWDTGSSSRLVRDLGHAHPYMTDGGSCSDSVREVGGSVLKQAGSSSEMESAGRYACCRLAKVRTKCWSRKTGW